MNGTTRLVIGYIGLGTSTPSMFCPKLFTKIIPRGIITTEHVEISTFSFTAEVKGLGLYLDRRESSVSILCLIIQTWRQVLFSQITFLTPMTVDDISKHFRETSFFAA